MKKSDFRFYLIGRLDKDHNNRSISREKCVVATNLRKCINPNVESDIKVYILSEVGFREIKRNLKLEILNCIECDVNLKNEEAKRRLEKDCRFKNIQASEINLLSFGNKYINSWEDCIDKEGIE